jgi:predicted nucleic acid-binding protein
VKRFLLDSSCMVALLCAWHAGYNAILREIEQRFDRGEDLIIAVPALIETYSVLTRLPSPYRISPIQCERLLEASFMDNAADLVALDVAAYRMLLQSAATNMVAGGSIYDGVIYSCAVAAKADALLTFNERHFRPFADGSIEILVPV